MKDNNYNLIKKIIKIGLPISLENMIYSLMNFIDIFMVGSEKGIYLGLGKVAVAGVGFANQIFNIFLTSLFGLNSGASILSSQYFGSKNYRDQKKCLSVTLFIGLSFSFIFLIGGWFIPEELLSIFTKDLDVIKIGTRYFKIAIYTFPLVAISMAYSMQLRAMGKTQYTFYSSIMGLLINIVTNYSLIYGNFGMPALGVEGAAYATVFARIISTIYTISVVYYYKLPIASTISELFNVKISFFIKTLKISLPVFVHEFFWILGASIYIVIFGRIGTDEAVSIEIVKSISNLTFTMLFGFCMATSVIIGNEIGSGKEDEAYENSIKLLYAGILFGIIVSVITYLIIPIMLIVMDVSPSIFPLTKSIAKSESILIITKSLSFQLVVGILRAGGDTLWTMFVDLIPMWFIAIPLTYFVGIHFQLPISIVYLVSGCDEIIKSYPCIKRLKSKKWINNFTKN